MAKAGKITIDISAGTAQFIVDMEQANRKLNEFGSAHGHAVTGVQATSAALRTLEGNFGNNIRAAENFIAKTLGLGNVLKAAFPVVGAIALGGVIGQLVSKVGEAYEAFQKLKEAPGRITESFAGITTPIAILNDELAVANDRLRNDIAKLEGKPQNNLALGLDEARVAADKLVESLHRDIAEVQKLLQTESIGAVKGLFTGTAPTSGLIDQWKDFAGKVTDINLEMNEKIAAESDPTKQTKLLEERTNRIKAAAQEEAAILQGQLKTAQDLQKQREAAAAAPVFINTPFGPALQRGHAVDTADQAAKIAALKGELLNLQTVLANISFSQANAGLKELDEKLKTAVEAAKAGPFEEALKKLQTERAAAAEELGATLAGGDDAKIWVAYAKGAEEAQKTIDAVNKSLGDQHKAHLTIEQDLQILQLAVAKYTAQYQTGVAAKFNTDMKAAAEASDRIADSLDSENARREKSLKTLNEEIAAAKQLAAAETEGSEAAWQAQEKIKLAKIPDQRGEGQRLVDQMLGVVTVPDERTQTLIKDQEEHAGAIAKTVAQLNLETAAYGRLTAAAQAGIDAQRAAELENKIAPLKQNLAYYEQHPQEDPAGSVREQINAQIAAEQQAAKARATLEDALNLRSQPLSAGIKSYFQELISQADYAAKHLHDIFANAFDGLNEQLSRLLTGQKASWAQYFQSLGQQLEKFVLGNIESVILKRIEVVLQKAGQAGGQTTTTQQTHHGGVLGTLEKIGGVILSRPHTTGQTRPTDGQDGQQQTAAHPGGIKGTLEKIGTVLLGGGAKGPATPDGTPTHPLWVKVMPGADSQTPQPGSSAPTTLGLGMRDGQSPGTAYFVTGTNGQGQNGLQQAGGIVSSLAGLVGAGVGAGIALPGGASGGAIHMEMGPAPRASGGPVDAGRVYLVGEKGPELFTPPAAGTIIPHGRTHEILHRAFGGDVDTSHAYMVGESGAELFASAGMRSSARETASGKSGAVQHFYTIDARGTDPLLVERRVRTAIVAAHHDAVATAQVVSAEHMKRTPSR